MDDFVYKLSNLATNLTDVHIVDLGSDVWRPQVDFFNPEWKSDPRRRATKCEYCRRTVFAWDKECPGCGASIEIYLQASS